MTKNGNNIILLCHDTVNGKVDFCGKLLRPGKHNLIMCCIILV